MAFEQQRRRGCVRAAQSRGLNLRGLGGDANWWAHVFEAVGDDEGEKLRHTVVASDRGLRESARRRLVGARVDGRRLWR